MRLSAIKMLSAVILLLLSAISTTAQNGVTSPPPSLSSGYSYVLSRAMTNASGTASRMGEHSDWSTTSLLPIQAIR